MTEAGPVLSEIRCLAAGQKRRTGKIGGFGLQPHGHAMDDNLSRYLSPLGWEHINLTSDYLWRDSAKDLTGFKFRFLRRPQISQAVPTEGRAAGVPTEGRGVQGRSPCQAFERSENMAYYSFADISTVASFGHGAVRGVNVRTASCLRPGREIVCDSPANILIILQSPIKNYYTYYF